MNRKKGFLLLTVFLLLSEIIFGLFFAPSFAQKDSAPLETDLSYIREIHDGALFLRPVAQSYAGSTLTLKYLEGLSLDEEVLSQTGWQRDGNCLMKVEGTGLPDLVFRPVEGISLSEGDSITLTDGIRECVYILTEDDVNQLMLLSFSEQTAPTALGAAMPEVPYDLDLMFLLDQGIAQTQQKDLYTQVESLRTFMVQHNIRARFKILYYGGLSQPSVYMDWTDVKDFVMPNPPATVNPLGMRYLADALAVAGFDFYDTSNAKRQILYVDNYYRTNLGYSRKRLTGEDAKETADLMKKDGIEIYSHSYVFGAFTSASNLGDIVSEPYDDHYSQREGMAGTNRLLSNIQQSLLDMLQNYKDISFRKIDSVNLEALSGAEFEAYYSMTPEGSVRYPIQTESYETVHARSDASGIVHFSKLRVTDPKTEEPYYLWFREVKAPFGYSLPDTDYGPYIFRRDPLTYTEKMVEYMTGQTVTPDSLVIENVPEFVGFTVLRNNAHPYTGEAIPLKDAEFYLLVDGRLVVQDGSSTDATYDEKRGIWLDASGVEVSPKLYVSDRNGQIAIDFLHEGGKYVLREKRPPSGYASREGEDLASFTVTQALVAKDMLPSDRVILYDQTAQTAVRFRKTDGTNPLSGGLFRILDRQGRTVVRTLTAGADGYFEAELPYGNYLLKELEAPTGHVLNNKPLPIIMDSAYVCDPSIAASDVSTWVNLDAALSSIISTNADSTKQVFVNEFEEIRLHLQFHLPATSDPSPGDYFYVNLSPALTANGDFSSPELAVLNIYDGYGIIAEGEYDSAGNRIKFTFTDYLNAHVLTDFDVTLPLFIDRSLFTDSQMGMTVYAQMNGVRVETFLDVIFETYRYEAPFRTSADGTQNLGARITYNDRENGRITAWAYINPKGLALSQDPSYPEDVFRFYPTPGMSSVEIEGGTGPLVRIYRAAKDSSTIRKDMPYSFGVKEEQLEDITFQAVTPTSVAKGQSSAYPNGMVEVEFGDALVNSNYVYLVKVVTPYRYEENQGKRLLMTASLNRENAREEISSSGSVSVIAESRMTRLGIPENGVIKVINVPKEALNVSFTLTDPNGMALSGATFMLSRDGDAAPGVSAVTDEKGMVTFTDLLDGKYSLVETKRPPGYWNPDEGKPSHIFTVVDKEVTDLPVSARRIVNYMTAIRVALSDPETGTALSGGAFRIEKEIEGTYMPFRASLEGTTERLEHFVTDSEGGFSVVDDMLTDGKYRIIQEKAPDGYALPLDPVSEFSITNGQIVSQQSIVEGVILLYNLKAIPGEVAFRAVNEAGDGLNGAHYMLYIDNATGRQQVGEAVSGQDGVFRFTGLDPGNYVLEESAAPAGYRRMSGDLRTWTMDALGKASSELKTDIVYEALTLPQTGGGGTMPYLVTGVLVMAGAGILLFQGESRKENCK